MSDVTQLLSAIEQGDAGAASQLLPLVYDERRRLAAQRLAGESPGQTLEPTALVHEAYLRLVGTDANQPWDGRGHFFAAAAAAMRRNVPNRQAPEGKLAVARFDVTLANADLLVPPEEGLWAETRSGLVTSLRGLAKSVNYLIVGVLFVLPWLLVIGAVVWMIWRIWRPSRAADEAPTTPAAPPAA
jgi:hypothetical protein